MLPKGYKMFQQQEKIYNSCKSMGIKCGKKNL